MQFPSPLSAAEECEGSNKGEEYDTQISRDEDDDDAKTSCAEDDARTSCDGESGERCEFARLPQFLSGLSMSYRKLTECHTFWLGSRWLLILSSPASTPRKERIRYGTMAVLAPDWAMSAGLADGHPTLSLSGHFLAIWPVVLHVWHFLSSIDI